MLAIAVEQQKAHAFPLAIGWYERALGALANSIAELHRSSQYVESPALDADLLAAPSADVFDRRLAALPPLPAAAYLDEVLASGPFQTQLGQLRDLLTLDQAMSRLLQGNDRLAQRSCGSEAAPSPNPDQALLACKQIEDLRPRVADLRAQLAAAAAIRKTALRQQLLDALRQQENWRGKLLIKARFELARLYDSAPPP
jgi:hypothetical protein